MMKTTYLLILFGLFACQSLFSQTVIPEQLSTTVEAPLGDMLCQIRADTNCVTQQVTLEAWTYNTFINLSLPITALWSTGITAHKIIVTPPGSWEWDVTGVGCNHFFNTIAYDHPFFQGPIDVVGGAGVCPLQQVELTVNTLGYDAFSSFVWSPPHNLLTPYTVNQAGNYKLTVTDALGCTFSDQINIPFVSPSGESCDMSCINCDFDGFQGNNNGTPSGGNLICGAITLHNDFWYGFVAGSAEIDIDVVTSNCQNGDGLQTAIFSECSDADAIVCDPGCGGCGDLTLALTYSDFIPGKTYWLVVDGYVADICDFSIEVTKGSVGVPVPALPEQPSGPLQICPGGTAVYVVPDAAGAGFYHWTAPQGASINGLSNSENIVAPFGNQVTITFGNAGGQVCVQTGNDCHPLSAQRCIPVANVPIPTTVKPRMEVCYEDLPFTWNEAPYPVLNNPGTFTLNSTPYASHIGCDSVVRQVVACLAPIVKTLSPVVLCPGGCFNIGGVSYCDPGPHSIVLQSFRGCDSVVNFSITYLNPVADIQGPNQILCGQSTIELYGAPSPGEKIWSDTTGQVIALGNTLTVSQPGVYILTILLGMSGTPCQVSDTIVVTADKTQLGVAIAGALDGCLADTLVLSCSVSALNAQFEWLGPNGFVSMEQNPLVPTTGTYTVTAMTDEGCVGTATVLVPMIGGLPDVLAQGDTVTCIQPMGQLTGGSNTLGATFSWTGPEGFQSTATNPVVAVAGQYVLMVTGPGGCTNVATAVLVSDMEAPVVAVPNSFSIICTSFPTLDNTLSTSNPVAYFWLGPNGFVSTLPFPEATLAGNYFVTVTDAVTGCTGTAATVVAEDQVILEIITDVVVQPTIGQSNGSISISVVSSVDSLFYGWYFNGAPMTNMEDISNLGPGTYTLIVKNQYGCSTQQTYMLQGVSATSDAIVDPWVVRPNPTAGRFEICCNGNPRKATQLLVYDFWGRQLLEQAILETQKEISVDLKDVPSGVYFLTLRDGEKSEWLKVVVQR